MKFFFFILASGQRTLDSSIVAQWEYINGCLPLWLSGKEFACNTGASGDVVSILGLGRSPGGGKDKLFFSTFLSKDYITMYPA